jgi:hypothetical protein
MGGNCLDPIDNFIFFLGRSCCCLLLEHCISYIFIKTIVDFMLHKIANEALVDDGIGFISLLHKLLC